MNQNKKSPNILLLLPDQWRADWLGFTGNLDLNTPNVDALAARGVAFSKAYTPSPLCAPARACLASGRNYRDCGVPNNHYNYPLTIPTYYQALRDKGYRVGSVGKLDLHKDVTDPSNMDWGLDGSRLMSQWGFTDGVDNEGKVDGVNSYVQAGKPKGPYLNYLHQRGLADIHASEVGKKKAYVTELPQEAYCDNWLTEKGREILRNFPDNQPWHMVFNFTGPHAPMDVTRKMKEIADRKNMPCPVNSTEGYDRRMRDIRNHYAVMIENIDNLIGDIIDDIDKRGELDNTIIVFASDHGEMLGDHNKMGKEIWYDPSSRIPLIAAGPGVLQEVQSDALVLLHDLHATFLDFAGCPPFENTDSLSLRPILSEKSNVHRSVITSELSTPVGNVNWKMVYDGSWKTVENRASGDKLLFNLKDDPTEKYNIYNGREDHFDALMKMVQY
jgi:arylsulfatase A-like enzyme